MTNDTESLQELGSMYDYLAKIILLGPSGAGKSCLLHRLVKDEWQVLTSQTIGVEFSTKIFKVGTGSRRKRIKFQLWDTAGTERFRSVSRSYYRGAAGAVLVYDVTSRASFDALPTFLNDARALASSELTLVLAGNKVDMHAGPDLPSSNQEAASTVSRGREVQSAEVSKWASRVNIPTVGEVSALTGHGVLEIFDRLASTILTKIELGEIDPNDPSSGIQYGDSTSFGNYDERKSRGAGRGTLNSIRFRHRGTNSRQEDELDDVHPSARLSSGYVRQRSSCC